MSAYENHGCLIVFLAHKVGQKKGSSILNLWNLGFHSNKIDKYLTLNSKIFSICGTYIFRSYFILCFLEARIHEWAEERTAGNSKGGRQIYFYEECVSVGVWRSLAT